MDNLLQSQIEKHCLTLPVGLKELMSDISREVLRAQPSDIYKFIANYLSALLVTRDNITVATHICTNVGECDCQPELFRELLDIGLSEMDAKITRDVIMKYFSKEKVNEGNLMAALVRKTAIDTSMIPAILNAVRVAFLRHQAHNITIYETSSESDLDEIAVAAKHTLNIYRQTKPPEEKYGEMADKIKTSYRAHDIRYNQESKSVPTTMSSLDTHSDSVSDELKDTSSNLSSSEDLRNDLAFSASLHNRRINTVSSMSLAGSMCKLPIHKPYNAHEYANSVNFIEELPEKEHAHIDYTARTPRVSIVTEKEVAPCNKNKRISFQSDSREFVQFGASTIVHISDDSETSVEVLTNEKSGNDIDTEHLLKDGNQYDDANTQDKDESIPEEEVESNEFNVINNLDIEEDKVSYFNVMNGKVDNESDENLEEVASEKVEINLREEDQQ